MAILARPTLSEVGDIYRFTWPDLPIIVELCGIEDGHGELKGELTIASALDPATIYESGILNLSAMQTRTNLGNNLKRDVDDSIDWTALLKQVCLMATRHFRHGEPSINLAEYQLGNAPRWFLRPYLEHDGFTIMYADGGSGKSVLALAMAFGMASGAPFFGELNGEPGPVLYLDWETGPATQFRRLRALANAVRQPMPPVIYRYMTSPLPQQSSQVREEIAAKGIRAVVVDSLGAAAGGPIEDSSTALTLGRVIRSLRLPVLAIHHKPKQTEGKRGAQVMFGSVYFANYCRLAWELTAVTYEAEMRTDVQFLNSKNNNGAREKRHAMSMQFTNDGNGNPVQISINPTDLRDIPEFAKDRPIWQQIADLLLHGHALTPKEIADELDANPSSVRSALKRLNRDGKAQKLANDKWGMSSPKPPF